ncbi:hypothetical protein NIES4072_56890 [Nostoc commune NIES-4072]|uniref:Uncharacterized protein n=1 Tax=Nostoc commune NIES-4072 TaxID=2005467 RepID=A0A2R5G0I8_NOSCO|nr:hypothetical protein [Nostoc commune]BBD67033.1 hypothetical protein NIES4070_34040 [Nostoc commune HK-02]GBG21983.1 hypothetical protein NIES4072_56890 [Nostoc commune NIES-4072]
MNQVNYTAMSDQELKSYFLNHKDDKEAFYAYMDRRKSRYRDAAIQLNDPAWEEKIIAVIQKQLGSD